MQYVKLGSTGLDVSRICLGCMTYGLPDRGTHEWTLDEEASRPLIRQALEAGVNFFDTANVYSDGTSEEIVGKALRDFAHRDEIVLATKVHGRMRPGPNGAGLSRKAIMSEIDHSLRRLGTDYVDLYQIHRYDHETPVEETMEALHDLVKAGKVRYIGASSMYAWEFSKAQYTAERHGWTKFVSMQNHYNLLYREEEREMLPLCADQGVGVLPWSPLARGRLTRDWGAVTQRSANDAFGSRLYLESDHAIVEAVTRIAGERGVPRAQVALAWLLHQDTVAAPIVGAAKPQHIEDAVAAVELKLSEKEIEELDGRVRRHRDALADTGRRRRLPGSLLGRPERLGPRHAAGPAAQPRLRPVRRSRRRQGRPGRRDGTRRLLRRPGPAVDVRDRRSAAQRRRPTAVPGLPPRLLRAPHPLHGNRRGRPRPALRLHPPGRPGAALRPGTGPHPGCHRRLRRPRGQDPRRGHRAALGHRHRPPGPADGERRLGRRQDPGAPLHAAPAVT
ncbi:hypothetical protein SCANM63S_03059 [Streptomyces canarius]